MVRYGFKIYKQYDKLFRRYKMFAFIFNTHVVVWIFRYQFLISPFFQIQKRVPKNWVTLKYILIDFSVFIGAGGFFKSLNIEII